MPVDIVIRSGQLRHLHIWREVHKRTSSKFQQDSFKAERGYKKEKKHKYWPKNVSALNS